MDKQNILKLKDVYNAFRDRQLYNPKLTWKDEIEVFFRRHWGDVRIFYFGIINGVKNIASNVKTGITNISNTLTQASDASVVSRNNASGSGLFGLSGRASGVAGSGFISLGIGG